MFYSWPPLFLICLNQVKIVRPVGDMDSDINHLLKPSVVVGEEDGPMAERNQNWALGGDCSVDCWVRKVAERRRVPVEAL